MKTDKTNSNSADAPGASDRRDRAERKEDGEKADFDSALERAEEKKRNKKKRSSPQKQSERKQTPGQKAKDPAKGEKETLSKSQRKATELGDSGGALTKEDGDVPDELWSGRVRDGEAQVGERETRTQRQGRKRRDEQRETRSGKGRRRDERRESTQTRERKSEEVSPRRSTREPADGAPKIADSTSRQLSNPDSIETDGGATAPDAVGGDASVEEQEPVATARRDEVARIAERIVESARVGVNADGQQLVEMTVEVPGRGRVDIKLKKRGRRFDVQMTPDSPALGRMLRRSRKGLKQQASQGGVHLGAIRVSNP